MLRLLRLFNFRHLRRRRLETLLCLLGIATGVAVMAGIDLANENAMSSFRRTVDAVTGRATHQILGGPSGIPDSLAAWILNQPQLQAAPIVEYVAACREAQNDALHLLGIDPFQDFTFRDYSDLSVATESLSSPFDETGLKLLALPGTALVSEAFLQKYALAIDDTLHVLVGAAWRPIIVVGTIPSALLARLGFENLALLDLSTAQEVLSRIGFVDRVDLIANAERAAQLAIELPAGLRLVSPESRSQRVNDMLHSFRLNLTALSFLAVFVGMFLIYNTMMFTVIHRRKQIGILRCLGVTPRQMVGNMLLESLALGVIGSLLGLALGIFLAQYATRTVSATISELYVFLTVTGVTLDAPILIKAFGLGMIATLAASAIPAFEAATTSAAVAVRRSTLESRAGKFVPLFALAGFGCLCAAFLAYLLTRSFWGGMGVALAVGFAAIFFTPILTIGMTQAAAPLSRKHAGQPGLLATRSIRAALSRTAVAIAALMLSLAMVLGMRLMITSFRATVDNWVLNILSGDVYLSPAGFDTARWQAVMSPEFLEFLQKQPEIEALDLYGATEFTYREQPIYLVALSAEVVKERMHFIFTGGSHHANWDRVIAGEVLISESFARHFNKSAGDTLHLRTLHGFKSFNVAAIFIDYSLDRGQVMMDHPTYVANWGPSHVTNLGVFLKPEVSAEDFILKLRRAVAGRFAVEISSNRELREEVLRIFDQSFAITHVMQWLAGIVAFIGIMSAVMSLLVERTRELGILRAVGMSLTQLRRMVFLESGLMGAFAGLLAIPTGVAFAIVLIYVINLRTFEWTIHLQLEAGAFVQIFMLALIAAGLAAVYPMKRLQKIPIAGAIREE